MLLLEPKFLNSIYSLHQAVAASRRSFVYWPYPTSLRPPRTEHPWVDIANMQALEFGFMTPGRWFVIAQRNTPDLLIQASRVLCRAIVCLHKLPVRAVPICSFLLTGPEERTLEAQGSLFFMQIIGLPLIARSCTWWHLPPIQVFPSERSFREKRRSPNNNVRLSRLTHVRIRLRNHCHAHERV